jgi:polyhydroxybutyrate depolymerase
MRLLVTVWSILAALVIGTAHAADSQEISRAIAVAGQTRTYLVHRPPTWSTDATWPLVINLHGGGGLASGVDRITHFNDAADRNRFIAVYPQGIDRHWDDGRSGGPAAGSNDVQFIAALIDKLITEDHVDRKRVYATGLSNGAIFSERLGCALSDRIAAIAPVAGPLPVDIISACHPSRPPAVLLIHGTADPLVPYDGGRTAGGGYVTSVNETFLKWHDLNGCDQELVAMSSIPSTDGMSVDVSNFSLCRTHHDVELIAIEGGGHTWPGGEQYSPPFIIGRTSNAFDASQLIWDFFKRFTL